MLDLLNIACSRRAYKLRFGTTNVEAGWNSSGSIASGVVFEYLVSEAGESAPIGFSWSDPPSATATNSAPVLTAPEGFPFPSGVLRNLVVDSGAVKRIDGVLSGLNPEGRYNVHVLGSRSNTTVKPCKVTVTGGASTALDPAFDAGVNTSQYGSFLAIQPNAAGEITVSVELSAGNTTGVFLNGIILEEY